MQYLPRLYTENDVYYYYSTVNSILSKIPTADVFTNSYPVAYEDARGLLIKFL